MATQVLVAEDDADMRSCLVFALMSVGVEPDAIVHVGRGDEALSFALEQDFNLLLLDWHMPGLDGMEIVQTLRDSGSDVPILMITGERNRDLVVAAIRGGITDYIVKPFDRDDLRIRLAKYCEEASIFHGHVGPRLS